MNTNNTNIYLGGTPLINNTSGGGRSQDSIYNYLSNPIELKKFVDDNKYNITQLRDQLSMRLVYADFIFNSLGSQIRIKGYLEVSSGLGTHIVFRYDKYSLYLDTSNNQILIVFPILTLYVDPDNISNDYYTSTIAIMENNTLTYAGQFIEGSIFVGYTPQLTTIPDEILVQ